MPYIVNTMLEKRSVYQNFDQFFWHVCLCVYRRQTPFLMGLHEFTSTCQNFADIMGGYWKVRLLCFFSCGSRGCLTAFCVEWGAIRRSSIRRGAGRDRL